MTYRSQKQEQEFPSASTPNEFTFKSVSTLPTDTLKEIIGTFEREWDEHIRRAPQLVRYGGTYFQGEINFMLERRVITLHEKSIRINAIKEIENGQWKGKWIAPEYESFRLQKSAMDELKWRRELARKHELRELEKSAPSDDEIDEIKISEITF